MRFALVLAVLCGCVEPKPLRPGQSQCTTATNPLTGITTTNCEQGQEEPAAEIPLFWCSTRITDNFGYCTAEAGECAVRRGEDFAPCGMRNRAICAGSGCFTTAEACVMAERKTRRDGLACKLVH